MEGPASLQGSYDDVEIRIFQEGDPALQTVSYYAELLTANGRRFDGELPPIPESEWEQIWDPREYGARVFQWLFQPGSGLEKGFFHARWRAEDTASGTAKIRLRLSLDPASALLHRVWWEAMYDPQRDSQVALTTAFSRFLPSEGPPAWPVAERPLRMLVVTSNPGGLERFGCAPLNTGFEQEVVGKATRGLGESLRTSQLTNASPQSLSARLQEERPHILYLLAHSIYTNPEGEIVLSDINGTAAPVRFGEVVELIAQAAKPAPALVFLALPAAAQTDFKYSLASLARRLVEAGVQAAVALHGPIAEDKIVAFSEQFFAVLTRQGGHR